MRRDRMSRNPTERPIGLPLRSHRLKRTSAMEPSDSPRTPARLPRPITLAGGRCGAFSTPLLALLAAWLVLMVVMAGAAAWYTSRPVFCNSCHIMEPYYKSWQESSHKDVTCIECHFPPGLGGKVRGKMLGLVQLLKYVTASAGPRPSAEIPDASCLRSGCHETRLLSGRVDFSRHLIPFDHTPHLQAGPPGQDPPLHELPQPDRAGQAHDRDHHHLLPLPLQGPALQREAQRLHALPPDSPAGVRPGRRREVHARAGLQERRRLQELPRRPDPRQRRRAPRTLPLLPQPRGRPGQDQRPRVHAPQARHRAQGRLHPVPHAHPAHPRSPEARRTPPPIASPAIPIITRNRSICSRARGPGSPWKRGPRRPRKPT